MSNTALIDRRIANEMNEWSRAEYSYIVTHLAKLCTCNSKYISCIQIYPGDRPGYDCGFVFFGPRINGKDTMLGEIRWDRRGRCTDFIPYEDTILEVRNYIARRRAERARQKSVNRSLEQAQEREVSLGKELVGFIKTHVKEIAATACLIAALASSYVAMGNALNPDYINDSYNAGYQAVSYETHRTQDNQGYWYDYHDIAGRYDEAYDFDSWVYGTYKNVGWNQQSKLDCMDEVFDALEDRGITEYDSFLEYCDAKGACKEKDGRLVVDTKEFREITEDYMRQLNEGTVEKEDGKKSGFRI